MSIGSVNSIKLDSSNEKVDSLVPHEGQTEVWVLLEFIH